MSTKRKILIFVLIALLIALSVGPLRAKQVEAIPVVEAQVTVLAPEEPIIVLEELTPKELLIHFAGEYKTSADDLVKTGVCESGLNEKAHNKEDPNGGSVSYMQFQQATFYSYAKKLNIEKPDIKNKVQVAQVAAYMFSIGEGKQWTAYRALKNGGSYTFFYKAQQKYITVYCK